MTASTVIRRSHMYLALFLSPWILMYALSTAAMNHREFFLERYGGQPVEWETERQLKYHGSFPEGAEPQAIARQLLMSLDLEGFHQVRRASESETYTIHREDLVNPRRITFNAASGDLKIERQVFRAPVFLERMHRRRGYRDGFPVDSAWALLVDLVIVAMVFWAASGLWMWWELRSTRLWGAVSAAAGAGLFVVFLLTI